MSPWLGPVVTSSWIFHRHFLRTCFPFPQAVRLTFHPTFPPSAASYFPLQTGRDRSAGHKPCGAHPQQRMVIHFRAASLQFFPLPVPPKSLATESEPSPHWMNSCPWSPLPPHLTHALSLCSQVWEPLAISASWLASSSTLGLSCSWQLLFLRPWGEAGWWTQCELVELEGKIYQPSLWGSGPRALQRFQKPGKAVSMWSIIQHSAFNPQVFLGAPKNS